MGRLIDADELKRNVLKWMPKDQSDYMDSAIPPLENLTVSMVMEIDDAPTVDAVPVRHGRWIPVDSYSAFGGDESTWMAHGNPIAFYYCSECKEQTYAGEDGEPLLTKYCPDCGALMDGKDGEQHE